MAMRLVRIVVIVVIVVGLFVGAVAGLALHNQTRIVSYVLVQVHERTGVQITIQGSRLHFRTHLVLDLERPELSFDGHEASLRGLRAVVSYHSLIFSRGLPLYALILDQPELHLPPTSATALKIPRPNAHLSARVITALSELAKVTRRLNIYGAALYVNVPQPDTFDLVAYHHLYDSRVWFVHFDSVWNLPQCPGVNLTGSLTLGQHKPLIHFGKQAAPSEPAVAQGRLWFWGVSLAALTRNGITANGTGHGAAVFTLTRSGRLAGSADFGADKVELTGARFKSPLTLGRLLVRAAFTATAESAEISHATLLANNSPALNFNLGLAQPYSQTPVLTAKVTGLSLAASGFKRLVASLRAAPPGVSAIAKALTSGALRVDQAALTGTLGQLSGAQIVNADLKVSASVDNVALATPAKYGLPNVRALSAALSFTRGVLTVSQGAGRAGNSVLDGLHGRLDLTKGVARIPYKFEAKATLDSAQIFTPLKPRLAKVIALASQISGMAGRVSVTLRADGVMDVAKPAVPGHWSARIAPLNWAISIVGLPMPVSLIAGAVTVRSDEVGFERLTASTEHGTAVVGGKVSLGGKKPTMRDLRVELHGIRAERWLPLLVDPKKLAVTGAVGGSVVLNGSVAGGLPSARGRFTMGAGKIQFGFLRSPIVVQTALLNLNGRGLALTMPGATLEGSPLVFKLTIADLQHPTMRVVAKVRRLDLEVMNFVRLPWEPPTPVFIFKIPVVGDITASTAVIEKLTMAPMRADFSYNNGDWRIYNCEAHTLDGTASLEVIGRQRDDWIHILGSVNRLGVGPLFQLKATGKPPMTGALYASADLWADTSNDFFQTLAGRTTLVIRHGRFNKFTLLSRMLGTIDIKNWLTASVPDPRIAGLPFDFLSAHFAGSDGVFYTDDMRLEGPVLDIVAQGNMNLATSYIDMQVGMLPFNTANWLVSKIPVIGKHVSEGSKGLVGAYFEVRGSYSDPDITPKPITSLFEMVKKVLALPINLIQPNTVK